MGVHIERVSARPKQPLTRGRAFLSMPACGAGRPERISAVRLIIRLRVTSVALGSRSGHLSPLDHLETPDEVRHRVAPGSMTHGLPLPCVRCRPGFRHDGIPPDGEGAEISRSLSGRAASRTQSSTSRTCLTLDRDPMAARSRSASCTAHASTYRSSCSASSSARAITNSPSLSSSSRARCRATQSHWRHFCEQNSRGRPRPDCGCSTLLHHRHRRCFVMTKWYACRLGVAWDHPILSEPARRRLSFGAGADGARRSHRSLGGAPNGCPTSPTCRVAIRGDTGTRRESESRTSP